MKKLHIVSLTVLIVLLTGYLILPPTHVQANPNVYDCSTATGLPQSECEALVALYNATDGDNWKTKTGWLQTTTPCEWYGVTCTGEHVTKLNFFNTNLTGILPPEIDNFTALTELALVGNTLNTLPAEIGNLITLKKLTLVGNVLTVLPPEIGNLTTLTDLDLYYNNLTTLPPEIGDLSSLKLLRLEYNDLITLPAEIGNLSSLIWLSLHGNNLTTLPSEIGNLSQLYGLWLDDNDLITLPKEIGNLTTLTGLGLGNNALTTLPTEIGNLTALTYLALDQNPLSGEVPEMLTALNQLSTFTFYATNWCIPATGNVPIWLANISTVHGTGQICGQSPGSLYGVITLPDTKPAIGTQVNLYRSTSTREDSWYYVTTTHTLVDGSYQFDGLGQGIDYHVKFVDPTFTYAPEYYDNQPTLDQSTPVTITLAETRAGIDGQLSLPKLPVVTVETESGSITPNSVDGTVIINIPNTNINDITVSRTITCTNGNPTSVTLTLNPPGKVYSMALVSGNQYQAIIPGTDITKDATLVVASTCGISITKTTVGYINLYDPSGTIKDAVSRQAIEGAIVTLYQVPGWEPKISPDDDRPNTCESNDSKIPGVRWSQPAPTELGIIVNPDITTVSPNLAYQYTDNVGHYGWDVSEGCWYVTVGAQGYKPLTSPVVGVPPEVTDLNLALMPTGFSVDFIKQATPATTVTNGSTLTYTLVLSTSTDAVLNLYDPLNNNLIWHGFTSNVPDTLTYTTGMVTGTVALSATTPLTVTFAVSVSLPAESFVGEYAQLVNTAYYYYLDETLNLAHASNTVISTIREQPFSNIFLPLVLKN